MGAEIVIKNFRSVSRSRIELSSPVTLLVGANGVGKTSLLYSIELLAKASDGSLPKTPQPGKGCESSCLSVSLGKDRYEAVIETGPSGSVTVRDPALAPDSIQTLLRNSRIYRFDAPAVEAGVVESTPQVLASGGQNLAAVLGWMRENSQATYQALLREVRCVAPYVSDFVSTSEGGESDSQVLGWKQTKTGDTLRFESLGSGVFKFVLLCAALMQPSPPKLLLLDDPTAGLDSLAASLLCELMHNFGANGGTVVASTQTSWFVDGFSVDEVLLVGRNDREGTVVSAPCPDCLAGFEDCNLGWLWESGILAPALQHTAIPAHIKDTGNTVERGKGRE